MLTPLSGGKNPPNTGSSFIYSHPHRVPTPSLFASQGNTPEALAATPAPALDSAPSGGKAKSSRQPNSRHRGWMRRVELGRSVSVDGFDEASITEIMFHSKASGRSSFQKRSQESSPPSYLFCSPLCTTPKRPMPPKTPPESKAQEPGSKISLKLSVAFQFRQLAAARPRLLVRQTHQPEDQAQLMKLRTALAPHRHTHQARECSNAPRPHRTNPFRLKNTKPELAFGNWEAGIDEALHEVRRRLSEGVRLRKTVCQRGNRTRKLKKTPSFVHPVLGRKNLNRQGSFPTSIP